MAATHSIEEARTKYETLPPEIKKILYSQEMVILIQKVGEKNQLHIDQTDALYTETGQVMLGFSDPQEFVEDISDILKVDHAKAEIIAKDVDELLFSKIREAMKKVYEENTTPEPITSAPIPPTPAPNNKLPPLAPRPITPPATPPQAISHTSPTPAPAPMSTTPAAPIAAPVTPPPPAAPVAPKPAEPTTNMAQADTMLSQKTVDIAKQPPAPPVNYKKDPYREPAE